MSILYLFGYLTYTFSFVNLLSLHNSDIIKEQPFVDFIKGSITVNIDPDKNEVDGSVTYSFKTLKEVDSIFFDAKKMTEINVWSLVDNHIDTLDFRYSNGKIIVKDSFLANQEYEIMIGFVASPEKALYFLKDYNGNDQIWTQGQGKYTSNWLPSFDDMNEKVEFDLIINYAKDYEVIANGKLVQKEAVNDSINRWQYDMQQPMSSYLLAIAIGKYNKVVETSESGIPLAMYFYPQDSTKFEFTYAHTKRIFDFLEKEIGYEYPWQNYKQVPVKDFLYAGMENTGTTIFSDAFVVDEKGYNDRNYVNVNAHELAHQWFGNLVTETSGTHHWLQEGFATYYALLAEKEIFGDDYFLYKLYESAEQLTALSKSDNATSLLDPKASSLTFYQRGAWALYALRDKIGEADFKITIHNYLQQFKFRNASTTDFISIAEEVSGNDLSEFMKLWLENKEFPSQQALNMLTKSDFIKVYLNLAQERTQPFAGKWTLLRKALEFPVNDYIGQEAIYQLEGNTSQESIALLDQAFETNNIYVRQAIATSMSKIPEALKTQYETLLKDASYATNEAALYHLWASFSADRKKYLDATKDIIGFNDKNVRMLWLVLSLSTENYETEKHQKFFQELSGYTAPEYHFSTRENAFTYLESLQAFSDTSLRNLAEGAVHHYWRFRDFCRKLLDKLLQDPAYKKKYVALSNDLPQKQKDFLQKKLNPIK